MEKKITREDVAKEAKVSVTAVSRTLNNSGYVKEDKKERIIQAAKKLGYKVGSSVLAPQFLKTKQIIFYKNEITSAYFNQMFHGILREAKKRGYRVLLDAQCEFENIKDLLVDGILFPTESIAEEYASTVGKNYMLPTVTVAFNESFQFSRSIPEVILDDKKVINTAIDYLMNNGHRKIGLVVSGDYDYSRGRQNSWETRLVAENIKHINDYKMEVSLQNDNDLNDKYSIKLSKTFEYFDFYHTGELAAEKFVKSNKKATAYICFNDDMAHGMIGRLTALGVRVPEDVSIMGIDGTYIRNHYQKKLTTVATYPERIGADCINILINIIEQKPYKYINNWSDIEILEGDTVQNISTL